MTDTPNTSVFNVTPDDLDERGYALLTVAAQQAVLPRKLEEGVYAVLNADGGIEITETAGYAQEREHDWERRRSDKPEFVHRQVTLLDVASFIDYLSVNTYGGETKEPRVPVGDGYAHATGGLEVWANVDDRKVTAILDGFDGLRKHTATLTLKTSREWGEWLGIDGKLIKQADFALFIEDHLSTIATPDGAKLLDICETLVGKTNANWASQQLLSNGQRRFHWEETVEAKAGQKGDLDVPTELRLVLRPFQGSDPIPVVARFRYRLSEGVLALGVKLAEPERVLEDAFNQVVAEVQALVPVHVNHGRP